MSTATQPGTQRIEAKQSLVLDVTWEQYLAISDALPDRAGLRTAYDGVSLELMVISDPHEWYKKFLGRMIEMLTLELGLPIRSGGQMTFRRADVWRGLEPDQCYWIVNEAAVRNKFGLDLRVDPPPDLVVEIDVASSSVDRMGIYAALGVPEVWRFEGESLTVLLLQEDGNYQPSERSAAFPFLPLDDFAGFLHPEPQTEENAQLRRVIESIRQQDFEV